jgi:hypothetical protein
MIFIKNKLSRSPTVKIVKKSGFHLEEKDLRRFDDLVLDKVK